MLPTDRQPLTIEARDLQLCGGRQTPGRECFLAGESDGQRIWCEVELFADDVALAFPGPDAKPKPASPLHAKQSVPRKQRSVLQAVAALFPEGIPSGYPAQRRDHQIAEWLTGKGIPVSQPTIRRALSAIDRD
ncbi:hypothetical protein ACLBWX_21440 [Methylobacterium sp. M6A4_1b]